MSYNEAYREEMKNLQALGDVSVDTKIDLLLDYIDVLHARLRNLEYHGTALYPPPASPDNRNLDPIGEWVKDYSPNHITLRHAVDPFTVIVHRYSGDVTLRGKSGVHLWEGRVPVSYDNAMVELAVQQAEALIAEGIHHKPKE